jgi:pimeloyl-ACP methyl ester carboxylesterase
MWGREQVIEVEGLPLRVVRAGSGSPLLLINGIGARGRDVGAVRRADAGTRDPGLRPPGDGRDPAAAAPDADARTGRAGRPADADTRSVLRSIGGVPDHPVDAGGRTKRDPTALREHLNDRLERPPSAQGYLQQLYAVTGWSSLAWLGRIRHETLIMVGDEDPLIRVINARCMAALMPHSRLRVVRGGATLPCWTSQALLSGARRVPGGLIASH